jgi:hypothetical protein
VGLFDKAKNLIKGHEDKVAQGLDKAAELIDQKTGGKHRGTIDKVVDQAKKHTTNGNPPA